MNMTIGIIITVITLLAGEITKLFNVDTKFIPIQNIVIAILASVICIVFKIEDMSALEIIVTCVFGTMGAGGIYDISKLVKNTDK